VVPPYVDAHLHLDYVYTACSEGATNTSGTLFEGIARWHDVKKTQTLEDARERALKGIQEEVSKGAQFIRTHIDVDDPRLTGLKAMLEIREQLKDKVTIQIVAFPQEGMYAYEGGAEMIEEALKMGADCVGAHLQGRQDSYPKRRGLTRVKELWESGINVCFGQDSINDPWYPVGNGNMMNILDNGIHLAQTMSFDELDRCLDLITYNGAKTLNVEDQYGIEEGKPANFLLLDANTPFEAVRQRADVLASIRDGEYLFKRPEPSYDVELDLFRKTK